MTRRWLALCLLAYPEERRQRDGGYLLDLATELGERSGVRRQALSLLRGGIVERVRVARGRAALVAGFGLAALVVLAGGVAVAGEGSVDVEVRSCAATATGCSAVDGWAADRERHGWRCVRTPSGDEVLWQCDRR
jgi:hypothetical protein